MKPFNAILEEYFRSNLNAEQPRLNELKSELKKAYNTPCEHNAKYSYYENCPICGNKIKK